MQNLEQLRAKHALGAKIGTGADGGDAVTKKVPAMIRENGFLGAMAFAKEKYDPKKPEKNGYTDVFNAIIAHLRDSDQLHGLPADFDGFLAGLCAKDAATLRAITAEAMAFLNYLRRFQ
jgi:CRISPR type III-B/RAMP module-associated protein Cmr5